MPCRGEACDRAINFGPAINVDSRFGLQYDGSKVTKASLELPTLAGIRARSKGTNGYDETRSTVSLEAGVGPYTTYDNGNVDLGLDVGATLSGAIGYRILGANFETCVQVGGIYRISALEKGKRSSNAELGICEVLDVSDRVRVGVEGKAEVDTLLPSVADLKDAPLKANAFVTVETSRLDSEKPGLGITAKAGVLKLGEETFGTAGLEFRAHGAETSSSTGD